MMAPRWRIALVALAILALFSLSSALELRGDLALRLAESEEPSLLSLSDSIGLSDSVVAPSKPKSKAKSAPKPKAAPKPKSSAKPKPKSSAKAKSGSSTSSKDISAWAYAELKRLAGIVESGGRAGAQKLGWSAYDKDRKNIGTKSGYTYNSASGDHTEKQMVDDKEFKTAVGKAKYVLIWSTQAPCVFGAAHGSHSRQPCSIILPNYVKTKPKVNFFVGFSSRKFAQHEYIKMKNAGMGTTWPDFQKKLQSMWKLPSANCRLLMWDGSADYKAGDWVKIALLEQEAHLMSEFHQHLVMHTLSPSASSSKKASSSSSKSGSSAGDPVPGHKKILQAVLHGGDNNKYKTAWQLGEEDGTLVGKVVNGSSFPTTWPKNVTYVAIWVSPFSATVLPPIFKYATFAGNHGVKINVVYLTTDPAVMPVAQVIDKAARQAKWDGWNLRFFTLLGSNDVPNRLWPPKVDAGSGSSPSAQSSSTANTNAAAEEPTRPPVGPYEVLPKS